MIDIVFLLLFFFLVVSRFQALEGMLPAQLPPQTKAVSTGIPQTPIRIRFLHQLRTPQQCLVTIDRFNETPFAINLLADELAKIRVGVAGFDRNTPVHLLADDDIPWEHVVNAYNAALAAEYEKIFFAGS
jgi:biopolymer transport protein ExbD